MLLLLATPPAELFSLSPGVSEYGVNVINTQAFIAADPSTIGVKRDVLVSDGAGGKKRSGSPLLAEPIVVRMIPQGADNATSNPITQTTNGELDRPDFVLLGDPGLSLKRDDYFDWHGRTWKILSIRDSPAYETKADVAIRKDV
jgi:hypothetical protein